MKVAVSWSGGKDSALAYHKAIAQGHKVCCIVAFLWENPSLAHPIEIIELQAEALRTKLIKAYVREPYFEHYRQAVNQLAKEEGIEAIITGDIAPLDAFHGNWMENVCMGSGLKVAKPLWGMDRQRIMEELMRKGFKVIFSCVKKPWFNEEWLGCELNLETLERLKDLSAKQGIDLCGENGEYHTLVLDSPDFNKYIEIARHSIERRNGSFFIRINEAYLKNKIKSEE